MKRYAILVLVPALLVVAPALFTGCETLKDVSTSYLIYRIDAGIVLDSGHETTGIKLKGPGEDLTAASVFMGRDIGYVTFTLQPLGEGDAMEYEKAQGLSAGFDGLGGATADAYTRIRNDRRGYLDP